MRGTCRSVAARSKNPMLRKVLLAMMGKEEGAPSPRSIVGIVHQNAGGNKPGPYTSLVTSNSLTTANNRPSAVTYCIAKTAPYRIYGPIRPAETWATRRWSSSDDSQWTTLTPRCPPVLSAAASPLSPDLAASYVAMTSQPLKTQYSPLLQSLLEPFFPLSSSSHPTFDCPAIS